MATTLYSKKSTGNQSERGFTLAELLIVVAIIAVLTAIAIPVFTNQLEKSREATDLANVRAAYAAVMTAAITNEDDLKTADGKYQAAVTLKQRQNGWATDTENLNIGGVPYSEWDAKDPVADGSCTVTVDPVTKVVSINWSGEATSDESGSGSDTMVDPGVSTSDQLLGAKTIRGYYNNDGSHHNDYSITQNMVSINYLGSDNNIYNWTTSDPPMTFYLEYRYYRYMNNQWYRTRQAGDPWEVVDP